MSSLEPLRNFRRKPCSLEHIASVVSAAMLCHQAEMMNPTNPPEKVQEIIALPPAIEQKIERVMPEVNGQIDSWSDFYDRQVFFDEHGGRAEEYFHVLVWSDDGTINYEETAREMLKQDDLNAEEKYIIACNHCLTNEIKTLRSNLKKKVILGKAERRSSLVYYWECISSKDVTTELAECINKNVLMTLHEHDYPVCTIDYFLNLLNLRERIKFFERTGYHKEMSFRSWENFLMKLTNEELVSLFYDDDLVKRDLCYELEIFKYLMRFWMHADFVVAVWMRIRDRFPADAFSWAIGEFFTYDTFDIYSTDHISLAVEIFNLAPYESQVAVCGYYIGEKFWNRDLNLTDVRLEVAILSITHPHCRRYDLWEVQWIDISKKYPADCFVQFMNVCCGEEGSEAFKMRVLEMYDCRASHYCFTSLMEMRFSEIDRFLNLFSSDTCRIMKTKQIILRRYFFWWASLFETDRFVFPPPNQLVDFIEGSFENIRSANEFKIQILSWVDWLVACYMIAGSDMFDWLKESVWMCSCNDDDFKLYKSKFLQLGVELAKASECDIPYVFRDPGWKSFLKWCSN